LSSELIHCTKIFDNVNQKRRAKQVIIPFRPKAAVSILFRDGVLGVSPPAAYSLLDFYTRSELT